MAKPLVQYSDLVRTPGAIERLRAIYEADLASLAEQLKPDDVCLECGRSGLNPYQYCNLSKRQSDTAEKLEALNLAGDTRAEELELPRLRREVEVLNIENLELKQLVEDLRAALAAGA